MLVDSVSNSVSLFCLLIKVASFNFVRLSLLFELFFACVLKFVSYKIPPTVWDNVA